MTMASLIKRTQIKTRIKNGPGILKIFNLIKLKKD